MTARRLAAVAAVYWFALLGGVVLYSAIRIDHLEAVTPIWIGAIAGTAVGQVLAAARVRVWLAAVIVMFAVAILGPMLSGELDSAQTHALWRALLPAAACGYLSLGDRGALVAFWYPAMVWMLSILDRTGASAVLDRGSLILLGALALVFVLFLRAREARRTALWTTVAVAPLARERKVTVLSEHPGGELGRALWSMIALVGAFGATAWAAPLLWQREHLDPQPVIDDDVAMLDRGCCPRHVLAHAPTSRWSEYLDLGRGDPEPAIDPELLLSCHECPDGAAVAQVEWQAGGGYVGRGGYRYGDAYGTGSNDRGDDVAQTARPPVAPPVLAPSLAPVIAPAITPPPVPVPSAIARPPVVVTPPPVTPVIAPPPAVVTPPPPMVVTPPPVAASVTTRRSAAQTGLSAPAEVPASLLRGIALLLGATLLLGALTLALRPLRRLAILRHLRLPWWPETVDQQVSNSWQLVLIALRDAGWRWTAGETPNALAERVGVDGVAECAAILDRARHGLGVDAEDLVAIRIAADTAYRAARAPLGVSARIAAQLRAPLT